MYNIIYILYILNKPHRRYERIGHWRKNCPKAGEKWNRQVSHSNFEGSQLLV
jgi:hypothetical protein